MSEILVIFGLIVVMGVVLALLPVPSSTQNCMMCGRSLPPDDRMRLRRLLNPRFPQCRTELEDCYRGLARRMGYEPTDQDVEDAVRARRTHG